jgi:hypothetical protein
LTAEKKKNRNKINGSSRFAFARMTVDMYDDVDGAGMQGNGPEMGQSSST